MAQAEAPKLLSQAAFAKRRGVSRKAVTVWKQKGILSLTDDGLVDVEKTEWTLDQRPPTYRGGVTHRPVRKIEGNNSAKPNGVRTPPASPLPDEEGEGDDLPVDALDLDSENLVLADAVRRKENYLGLLRRRELEISNGEWVRVDEVITQVTREYAIVRERLLSIPGKVASLLINADRLTIEATLRREVTEALHELHDPVGSG